MTTETAPDAPLFLNGHGLGRFGVVTIKFDASNYRHTAAMHLLQSGVELNVIKSWLGHVSVTTTSEYIEIDMAMKREALERCSPSVAPPSGDCPWHAREDIVQWLEDL